MLDKLSKKLVIPLFFAFVIATSGCYLLETKTNATGATGKETTNLETLLTNINAGIETVSPTVKQELTKVKQELTKEVKVYTGIWKKYVVKGDSWWLVYYLEVEK